jgi:hypothetical protein
LLVPFHEHGKRGQVKFDGRAGHESYKREESPSNVCDAIRQLSDNFCNSAQRFNAGVWPSTQGIVPSGTKEASTRLIVANQNAFLSSLTGLDFPFAKNPALKRWAIVGKVTG